MVVMQKVDETCKVMQSCFDSTYKEDRMRLIDKIREYYNYKCKIARGTLLVTLITFSLLFMSSLGMSCCYSNPQKQAQSHIPACCSLLQSSCI